MTQTELLVPLTIFKALELELQKYLHYCWRLRPVRQWGCWGRLPGIHFEGIWSEGDGLYKLPFWSFDANLKPAGAGLAIVQRLKNGEFSDATWITFPNPVGVTVYTNDSVWDRASVGGQISITNPGVFTTYAAFTSIS